MEPSEERLDLRVARQYNLSRAAAQQLIQAGGVRVNGEPVRKPGAKGGGLLAADLPGASYVSRGGYKLAAALEFFRLDVRGEICLDVGAATGGFTDCMLRHGAARVYAVENGRGQLAPALRRHPQVVALEDTDIRGLALPQPVDFVAVDVSFISLAKVMPHVLPLARPGARGVCLVKPQFEAGPGQVNRRGILRDEAVRGQAVATVEACFRRLGLGALALMPSPIAGKDGNIEYLLSWEK
jgi:23S rRNA (cytidine1920-2'-O)/16S rRNA (cytidine1409-2'-O)-methyltransferase